MVRAGLGRSGRVWCGWHGSRSSLFGRSLEPSGRSLEPSGRSLGPFGRSLEPLGRPLEPSGYTPVRSTCPWAGSASSLRGGLSSMAEQRFVEPPVEGSSPSGHPNPFACHARLRGACHARSRGASTAAAAAPAAHRHSVTGCVISSDTVPPDDRPRTARATTPAIRASEGRCAPRSLIASMWRTYARTTSRATTSGVTGPAPQHPAPPALAPRPPRNLRLRRPQHPAPRPRNLRHPAPRAATQPHAVRTPWGCDPR